MAAGNVIFGGIIGLGVDAASGALNKFPDMVTVVMSPRPSMSPAICERRCGIRSLGAIVTSIWA